MLDSETKRRIDTARDILVGKVPDPKSQVEQITIALIYKFMDDMDAESEELGGKRKFFTGKFAQYGWPKLMHSGLGGHEVLNLYAEAISRMPENPGIPSLFRDIFKHAFLPYRDPETLKSFLKIIDGFHYDHSERLGDAFEYLLSVLGSQGDAGQFRTPRHIIDFIVSIVDPQKGDVILDPACGTAGFLISAYKHILRANSGKHQLTPDERGRLAKNLKGYDISPDMVRLSLVNLYLHSLPDPHIVEYDTLTSEERWNEYADVILANPPFMSPKGGIKPHKRFSIDAKRSEVLFVDYIAEHLTPTGRAGIIVPEGIIFQSQTAYKALRKSLVETSLVAVISLPAGCFNPYSGVKTSILILDKSLAKQSDTIAFFKIENDGFGLGAQRRAVENNDIPQVKAELDRYLNVLRTHASITDLSLTGGLIVPKTELSVNGDYNLSGERYRKDIATASDYPRVALSDVCDINPDTGNPAELYPQSFFNYIDISCVENESGKFLRANRVATGDAPSRARRLVRAGDLLLSTVRPNLKAFTVLDEIPERSIASTGFAVLRARPESLLSQFLIRMIRDQRTVEQMNGMMGKGAYPSINQRDVESLLIPLPPLKIQQEIVTEIEGYQRVIDGARAVLDNYRPHIPIHPDWPTVTLEEVCEIQRGKFSHRPRNEPRFYSGQYPFIQTGDIVRAGGNKIKYTQTLNDEGLSVSRLFQPPIVVITIAANIGDTAVLDFPCCFPDSVVGLIPTARIEVRYLEVVMRSKKQHLNNIAPQAAQKNINIEILKTVEIPLPPLDTQRAIVAEIEAEQALVAANRDLITRFERKIQATLSRVWGDTSILTTTADGARAEVTVSSEESGSQVTMDEVTT